MGILGFKSRKDEVLDHWISFADGFTLPPQEFYDALEKELAARKIPSMEMSRVEYAEGGLLSDQRMYLRMMRERLAIETCVAPFGTSFFFSCRTIYSPAVVNIWHLLVMYFFVIILSMPVAGLLGARAALLAQIAIVIALIAIFQKAPASRDLDSILLSMPAFGPIYERWFRKDSYFRQDARLVYLKVVPEIVRKVAEDMTATKGVKLIQQYQRAPILGELYKLDPSARERLALKFN